jgi:hypothetical protein
MFEYDYVPGATNYKIHIESTDNVQPFFFEIKNKSLACIVSDLNFGRSYKWHFEAFNKKKLIFKSGDLNFSINKYSLVDYSLYKTIIEVSKKEAFNNDIIFLDYLGVAIDRTGKPVWFYPSTSSDGRIEPNFRNMRMTNNGTITFQDNDNCYETDVNGKLLWKAPNDGRISGDKREFYHHDFRKLKDGTFLTTSYQYVEQPNFFKPSVISRVRYNTLIQYDVQGKILWSWNEKDHVKKEILFRGLDSNATEVNGTHLNGFDYDEKENAVVMSFRDNSSILKIDKQTGNIIYNLASYGAQSGITDPWFSRQHGPMVLPGHRLLIYNNNAKDTIKGISYPKILILQEPESDTPAKILWEYECRSNHFPNGITGKEGYASPLPNGNILVNMGGANFAFEVTMKKEIVWEAYFEKFDQAKNQWTGFNNYRCTSATSLYPKYFTVQPAPDNAIQINNEGTDEDFYFVEGLLADVRTKLFTDTINLKGRSSAVLRIPLDGEETSSDINILISSLYNPLFPKLLTFKPARENKK